MFLETLKTTWLESGHVNMAAGIIHWNVHPEIVNIMGLSLRYYGVLFAGGILACLGLLKWMFRNERIAPERLDTLTLYGVVGILLGARLGHCLLYEPGYYLYHPLEMLLPIQLTDSGTYQFAGYQGLASHGGIAGLLGAVLLYAKRTGESVIRTIDLIAVVAPLGGCFIRLGNLMNSEIIGYRTTVPWAFVFERQDGMPRHPAQLYEAICYLLIFLLVIYLYKSHGHQLRNGIFVGTSMSLIFIARFFIEFVKERQVSFENQLMLDMGQLLSIPFILVGLGFLIHGLAKGKKVSTETNL